MLIFGCFVQHICFFYYIHFGVTYKPKWAGYYIVNIFILLLDLFVRVTIIKLYNTYNYMRGRMRCHGLTFSSLVTTIVSFNSFCKQTNHCYW